MSKLLLQGNQAIVYAAERAGLGFFAGYSITPASEILLEFVGRKRVKVLQMEDEIASINAIIGASLAGAKDNDGHQWSRLLTHAGKYRACTHDGGTPGNRQRAEGGTQHRHAYLPRPGRHHAVKVWQPRRLLSHRLLPELGRGTIPTYLQRIQRSRRILKPCNPPQRRLHKPHL